MSFGFYPSLDIWRCAQNRGLETPKIDPHPNKVPLRSCVGTFSLELELMQLHYTDRNV